MGDARPQADDKVGGLSAYLSMTRLLVGWGCAGLGALNLAMGAAGVPYVIFHVVMLIAGLTLLSAGLLRRRPGRVAWLTGGAVALLGLLISTLPRASAAVCCLSDYDARHGYPFTLLATKDGHWHLDAGHAVADLFFWACIGMFALLAITAATPRREPAPPSAATSPRHAEPRPETVDDENVRGLP